MTWGSESKLEFPFMLLGVKRSSTPNRHGE